MSKNTDDAIVQTLTAIKQILETIYQLEKQPNPKAQFMESKSALATQIKQLQSQLNQYKENQFTYEFYEELSQAIEKATHIRLSQPLQNLLSETKLISSLNDLTQLAQLAVYQHPGLKTQTADTAPAQTSSPIEAAHRHAEVATRRSTEATAAAERASSEAMRLLQKIQAEQKKSGGLLSRELLDESLRITMDMHIKQAAAVIEADLAATALHELEDLLKNRRHEGSS